MSNGSDARNDIKGINDCIKVINDVKRKVTPVLVLMSSMAEINPSLGTVLTNEDVADIGLFLREELGKALRAADSIGNIYRRGF